MIFGGAVAYWLYNTLSAVVRGTGNMALPATVMVANGAIYLALSPALIMGWGPLPRLGVAGAAAASVTSFALGSLVLGVYLASGRSLVTLSLARFRPRWALFRDILRVGAPGSLNTVFTNLTIVLVTALVGPFGAHALAGYGMGARLEYLQIPLVFGLGAALVTMVGTNIGAGQLARAQRVAWVGLGTGRAGDGRGGALRRALPSRVARALQHATPRCSRRGRSISAPSGRCTASSASGWRCTSPRRARDGSAGRSSPALRAWRSPAAGASSPCAGSAAGSRRSSR